MQFSNLVSYNRRFVGKIQTAESIRISVKTDISEVLSVGVDSNVSSYEASKGEASFYGKTNVKLLYSDGTTVNGQNYNADFTATVSGDMLDTDSKLTFDVATVETKVETNANTATLTILLEISVFAYVADSTPYLCPSEGVFCNTDSVEYLQSANVVHLPLVVDEELNATHSITSVLLAESCLVADEYTFADGILHVTGSASVRLTYTSEGNIVTDVLPFKFDRELDAAGIDTDSQLRILLTVKNTKVRLNLSDDAANTLFSVEIAASARAEAVKIGACDIVNDAYAASCDYEFQRKSIVLTLPCGSAVERKRISATLPVEGGKTPISAINVSATVTNCTSFERHAEVEGVVQATVLYSSPSGTESAPIELPFAETLNVDYLMPQCKSYAYAVVTDLTVKDTGALQADAELCFVLESERDAICNVIVSAEERPFDKASLPAIEVCLAHKGETVWQLCKGLHMSQEDLLSVNPQITSPLQEDMRIVVFNKI